MKKRLLAWMLCLALLLSGCSSLLNRSRVSVVAHSEHNAGGKEEDVLKAESYPGLVNAVRYCVSQGMETGEIQLNHYSRDVGSDLTTACLAITQTDPLAAYAVDYIKHDFTRILSYYKVNISIRYRRSREQVASIVNVTGSSAIQAELADTLSTFQREAVLRISAFSEDEAYIEALLRQAYHDTPATALGMPRYSITCYPDTGSQRIVEILLTYPQAAVVLEGKSRELARAAAEMVTKARGMTQGSMPERLLLLLREKSAFRTDIDDTSTAYAALLEGAADSEGLALAYRLLCDTAGLSCTVVQGTDGEHTPVYWNILETENGYSHVDPTQSSLTYYSDQQLSEAGLRWDADRFPPCDGPPVTAAPDTSPALSPEPGEAALSPFPTATPVPAPTAPTGETPAPAAP